jgi:hypothetical protein
VRVHAGALSLEQKITKETKGIVDQKSAVQAKAAGRCFEDTDDSRPSLAAARVLRCLRFLLFPGGLHQAGPVPTSLAKRGMLSVSGNRR